MKPPHLPLGSLRGNLHTKDTNFIGGQLNSKSAHVLSKHRHGHLPSVKIRKKKRKPASEKKGEIKLEKWNKVSPLGWTPHMRESADGAFFGTKFYLFGGVGGCGGRNEHGGRCSDVCVMDFEPKYGGYRWELLQCEGKIPPPRSSHTVTRVGDEMWIFGGEGPYLGLNKRTTYDDAYVFTFSTATWRQLILKAGTPVSPGGEKAPTSERIQDRDIRFGCGSVLTEGSTSDRGAPPALPSARRGHAAALIGERLVLFGGMGPDRRFMQDVFLNDVHCIDTKTLVSNELRCTGIAPSPRSHHTATASGTKLFVFGGLSFDVQPAKDGPCSRPNSLGRTQTFASDRVFMLDVDALEWSQPHIAGVGPGERYGHTTTDSCNAPNLLYVFGGRSSKGEPDHTLFVLDTKVLAWSTPKTDGILPCSRYSHMSKCYPKKDQLCIFGGSSFTSYCSADFYMLKLKDPPPPPPPPPEKVPSPRVFRLDASPRTNTKNMTKSKSLKKKLDTVMKWTRYRENGSTSNSPRRLSMKTNARKSPQGHARTFLLRFRSRLKGHSGGFGSSQKNPTRSRLYSTTPS